MYIFSKVYVKKDKANETSMLRLSLIHAHFAHFSAAHCGHVKCGDTCQVCLDRFNVALCVAAATEYDIVVTEVRHYCLGVVIVENDFHCELKGRLGSSLEDLGILGTVSFAHEAREDHSHVDLLCHIEIEAGLVVGGGSECAVEGVRLRLALSVVLEEE